MEDAGWTATIQCRTDILCALYLNDTVFTGRPVHAKASLDAQAFEIFSPWQLAQAAYG
jgi:hypothetical protein